MLSTLIDVALLAAVHAALVIRLWPWKVDMSKLSAFAAKAPQVIKDLEAMADEVTPQLDALASSGGKVMAQWKSHIADTVKDIAVAQDAINQLSNGAPPLADSPAPAQSAPASGLKAVEINQASQ